MNIGIDAKWFFTGNPSGRTIVRNLLGPLIAKNPDHTFFVFLKRSDRKCHFPIKAENVKVVYVPSMVNMVTNLLVMPFLAFIYRIDLCVYQYFSPLFSRGKRITFIYDVIFHEHPEFFTRRELLYFLPMRVMARRAHLLCTDSANERARLIKYGYNRPDRTEVVYLGKSDVFHPLDEFSGGDILRVKQRYGLPERFILYVGRLNERKNIRTMIRAMPLLTDRNISFVLSGSKDWKMSPIAEEIKKSGIENRIIQTGFVDEPDLPVLYSLAKLFCYVSYDEGFGLPVLEAMASGVPVVVANTGSLPEICGEAGNFVSPHDPADVAGMISILLTDERLYSEKRLKGMERAKDFTWDKTAERLMTLIERTGGENDRHSNEKELT
jgi:glycosyltransferase involved in cell wall biosynthesis